MLAYTFILQLNNISSGLVVYPAVIKRRVEAELPFVSRCVFLAYIIHD